MKKLVLLLAFLLVAVPALAQTASTVVSEPCDVSFDVDVTKCKTIIDDTLTTKCFTFVSLSKLEPNALADCEVYKCDYNAYNRVSVLYGNFKDEICGSFNDFKGIGQANQAAGFMNNQGNIVAVAATDPTNPPPTYSDKGPSAMTQVGVEQTNYNNTLGCSLSVDGADPNVALIDTSFKNFQGIGQVNQAPGFMNNQNNVVAISAGLDDKGVLATNDTFLTQKNTCNTVNVLTACNSDKINASFNGFQGIGQANQSSGSMNNQANIVSISYAGPKP